MVFFEYDRKRSDELLDPDLNLDELRTRFEKAGRNRQANDDVTRSLWFHLQAFAGMTKEIDDVKLVLDEIGDLSVPQPVEMPFWKNDKDTKHQEKAICRLLRLGCDSGL